MVPFHWLSRGRRARVRSHVGRVLAVGYFARGNLGDDAMRKGLGEFLRKEYPAVEVRWLSLPPVRNPGMRRVAELLAGFCWADAVVLSGGSHFHDRYRARSVRILLAHWTLFLVARATGASVGYAGVGVGPLSGAVGRWLTRLVLDLSAVVLARDRRSSRLIRSLGTKARLIDGFDAASLLVLPGPRKRPGGRCIGVSILPYFSTFQGNSARDRLAVEALASALISVLPEGYSVDVLPFQTRGFVNDVEVSEHLVEALIGEVPARLCEVTDPTEMLAHISSMDGFFATRYHAAVLGYLVGVPMLMLAYDDKCRALAEEVSMPAHAVLAPRDLLMPGAVEPAIHRLLNEPQSCLSERSVNAAADMARVGLRTFMSAL